jgi:hypothetical protein
LTSLGVGADAAVTETVIHDSQGSYPRWIARTSAVVPQCAQPIGAPPGNAPTHATPYRVISPQRPTPATTTGRAAEAVWPFSSLILGPYGLGTLVLIHTDSSPSFQMEAPGWAAYGFGPFFLYPYGSGLSPAGGRGVGSGRREKGNAVGGRGGGRGADGVRESRSYARGAVPPIYLSASRTPGNPSL